MKQFLTCLLIISMQWTHAQDWAQLNRYQKENEALDKSSIDVVFLGDSITEGWPQFHPQFFTSNPFVGRGIGGQTTPQMLVRFRQDVIALEPRKVVLLAGINDIAQNTGPISVDQIMDNIKSMTELAAAHAIEMVICSVLPANSFPWRPEIIPTQLVIDLNEKLKAYANENNLIYVDYYTAMVDQKGGLKAHLGYDTVHPNSEGYTVMENVLSNHLTINHE